MSAEHRPRAASWIGVSFPIAAWAVTVVFLALPVGWPVFQSLHRASVWSQLTAETPRLTQLLLTTLQLALGVVVGSLLFGLPAAVTLFRLNVPGRRFFLFLLMTAAFTPLVLYAAGWQAVVGPYGFLQLPADWSGPSGGLLPVIVIHTLAALPWTIGILGVALAGTPHALEEHALLDAPASGVLGSVTLPLVRPALGLACLLAVVPVLTDISITDLYKVRSFAEEVYTEVEVKNEATTVTLAATALSFLMAMVLYRALSRMVARGHELSFDASVFPLDQSTVAIALAAFVIVVVYSLALAGLVRQVGLETVLRTQAEPAAVHWSVRVAGTYLWRETQGGMRAIITSLVCSALSGFTAVAISLLLACHWRWSRRWIRLVGGFLACWLAVAPGPVLGAAFIDLWNRPGLLGRLYDSPTIVWYAQVVRTLPIALALVALAVRRIDQRLAHAAILEGASPWQLVSFYAIVIRPSLVLAWLATTALALTELPVTHLIAPPGMDPLSFRIFHLLHTGTGNQQAALSLVLFLLLGFGSMVTWIWYDRRLLMNRRADKSAASRGSRAAVRSTDR